VLDAADVGDADRVLDFRQADAESLPSANASFDAVVPELPRRTPRP
jgi:hypothetical protein